MKKNEEFIIKAQKVHGDKYNYSLVDYKSSKKKIKIICRSHGIFEQTPEKHLSRKQGCPKCSKNYKLTKDEILKKIKLIHGDKYDYKLINYENNNNKIKIICKTHGVFEQEVRSHLNGSGCPKCAGKNKTTEEFIKEAKKVHGDKYNYTNSVYTLNKNKIAIECKIHGVFLQTPHVHLNGSGCASCSGNKKRNNDNFILEARKIHGDEYDYSQIDYKKNNKKIKIICKNHGEFLTTPIEHLNGRKCQICKKENPTPNLRKTTDDFIKEAKETHGEKYDYSETIYFGIKNKLDIKCYKHGIFSQEAGSHIYANGCPKCSITAHKKEKEIKEFIESLNIEFIENNREILNGKEIDIFIPSKNIAIEFNGVYWHSDKYINDKKYHLKKTIGCEKKGIRLIQIFEDEWEEKKIIVKSRIKNFLGINNSNKIFARKTIIKEISSKEAESFMNDNHIQGYVKSNIRVGLFYCQKLVSVMLFSKEKNSNNKFILTRFSSDVNSLVIGGASKLLNYFIKEYKPLEITTYADRRWSQGDLYEKLGFNIRKINDPSYWYVKKGKRYHKSNFRKEKLKKMGVNIENKTEETIMKELNFLRIYDCGIITYKKTLG